MVMMSVYFLRVNPVVSSYVRDILVNKKNYVYENKFTSSSKQKATPLYLRVNSYNPKTNCSYIILDYLDEIEIPQYDSKLKGITRKKRTEVVSKDLRVCIHNIKDSQGIRDVFVAVRTDKTTLSKFLKAMQELLKNKRVKEKAFYTINFRLIWKKANVLVGTSGITSVTVMGGQTQSETRTKFRIASPRLSQDELAHAAVKETKEFNSLGFEFRGYTLIVDKDGKIRTYYQLSDEMFIKLACELFNVLYSANLVF